MLTPGALAMYATAEMALLAPPPNRPTRPARKTNQRSGMILRAVDWLLAGLTDQADDRPWLPHLTRAYPY